MNGVCKTCNKTFEYYTTEQTGAYCSRICFAKPQSSVKFICEYCNLEFMHIIYKNHPTVKYCSMICGNRSKAKSLVWYATATSEQKLLRLKTRFEANINKREDGCWDWTAGTAGYAPFQYGTFRFNAKKIKATKASWMINNNTLEFPKGLCLLHKCDRPICVAPHHIFLGTNKDNSTDKVNKNRQQRKLTDEQVKEIKRMIKDNVFQDIIAEKFKLAQSTISKIKLGYRYSRIKE